MSRKILLNNLFSPVWTLTAKTCIFTGKILAMLEKQEKCFSTTVFSSFLVFDKTNLGFDRIFFGRLVESAFYVSKETLTEQRFRKEFQKISEMYFAFLPEGFWKGCQNYFLRVQRNTYRETFSEGSLENLRIFGYFLKFLAQWRKTFLRIGKTAIDVRGNSLWKNLFQKRKIRYFFQFCL